MILFFHGPNSYASRRKLQEVVAQYQAKTGSDFGLERIDGVATDAKALAAALRAVPFLATSRLVIVEYLSANKAASGQIEAIIQELPTTTVVVFYEKEVDKRTVYFKTLSTKAQTQFFSMLGPTQLAGWVNAQSRALDATIEPGAMAELIDRVGDDQWRLEQELGKLANHDVHITREHVQQLVEPSRDENIFGLVEAIANGRTKQALAQYQLLLDGGTGELYILSMIIWQLRNLLLAKTAGPMAPGELARAAGLSPFVAGKAAARQADLDLEQLKAAFLAAVDTEYQIKTGTGKPDALVEMLVYNVSKSLTS